MVELISDLFISNNFSNWNDFRFRDKFDLVFKNQYEAYLIKIYDHVPSINEIMEAQQYIYEYIVRLPNENALKYNTNLIICHAFDKTPEALILESDKYTCRKYFLNTSSEATLKQDFKLLPFVDLSNAINNGNVVNLETILIENLGTELYSKLISEESNFDSI